MTYPWRHRLAAAVAGVMALYVTTFARQTHHWIDLPTWIDLSEWPATLFYLGAAWAAWAIRARLAAILSVGALLAFYAAQSQHLFAVPLGFFLVTAATLAILLLMPATTPQ
ncbi:MAG: hypothetical protein QNJ13_17480 [Paracoccaceae bacterium]|nr:hypothetical protein [Paracoccaceae bacterium]